jgi:two-component system chemotaxis response regulator CheY
MRALVIDDSRAMRSILGTILREIEFAVDEVGSAEEAVDALESGAIFDLALVDWNLPGMNGLELVKVIRGRPDLGDIRLMMVTTETEIERVREALAAGADEYIMKPFDRDMLLEKLGLLGIES